MKFIRTLLVSLFAVLAFVRFAIAEPALYAISDEDTTLYVLGTFHLLPPGTDWRSDTIAGALDASDAVYFEADVWGVDPATMQGTVLQHGYFGDGTLLPSLLTDDEWAAVVAMGAGFGMPADAIAPMRPWFAAVTYTTVLAMSRGYNPATGADATLYVELRRQGRDLRFFETYDEQMEFLSSFSQEVQARMLMETVLHADEAAGQFDTMYQLWVAGDLDGLDALGNGAMRSEYPDVYQAIIVDRNERWVEELSELMETPGTYFVAVGSLHLPGPEGVLSGMGEAGYEVTRQ